MNSPPEDETSEASGTPHEFRWYMAGYATFFFGMGLQGVIVPWLVAVELQESAERLGLAQMAGMLPGLLLVLVGGLLADRAELRAHLIRMTAMAALPAFALAALIMAGALTFPKVVAYAVLMGTFGALIMPARDALLTNVAIRTPNMDIARAVSSATFAQFLAQLAGFAVAGVAGSLGPATLLGAIGCAFILSAAFTTQITSTAQAGATSSKSKDEPKRTFGEELRSGLSDMKSGLAAVWHSDRIYPVVLQLFLTGIFGMGVFLVLLPILIRDELGGGSEEIAFSLMGFFGGVATTALGLRLLPPILHQGRAMMISGLGGTTIIFSLHWVESIPVLILFTYCWGLTAGMNMTMSRTIVQQSAPPTHRARILSVFSMGFLGGGPVGALLIGYLIAHLGARDAVFVPAAGMVGIFAIMFTTTRLWYIQSSELPANTAASKPVPAGGAQPGFQAESDLPGE